MRFYTGQHTHYCGVDLHTQTLCFCILDRQGDLVLASRVRAHPESFLRAVAPYRADLVVGVECIFTWYWLADLCRREHIAFVLGHALYMRAIHGDKTKNDRLDAHKIAALLRGGLLPMAYVYPEARRATRDLLRRRTHFVRRRAALLSHLQNTSWQYRLAPLGRRLRSATGRQEIPALFDDPLVRLSVEADLALVADYTDQIRRLERVITERAQVHDRSTYELLRSVPGIGPVLALVFLYEIGSVDRFGGVGSFCSYARLIAPQKTSAGKVVGSSSGKKIGNAHLKWAFSEASLLLMRQSAPVQRYVERLRRRHGRAKALGILRHKLGRALYFVLKRGECFDQARFLGSV